MAVYELLERQVFILSIIFGALSLVCAVLIFHYNSKKAKAAARETTWQTDRPNDVAVRFQFQDNAGKDLGWLYTVVELTKLNPSGDSSMGKFNMVAKDNDIFLRPGGYSATFETNEYKVKTHQFFVEEDWVQQRQFLPVKLELK